jgi:hypothetical protein
MGEESVVTMQAIKGAKRSLGQRGFADTKTVPYDLSYDPAQHMPIRNKSVEKIMCDAIISEMVRHEAPSELYKRFDLPALKTPSV